MANILHSNDSPTPVSDPALPKNPFADTKPSNPSEPSTSDITKPADAPVSPANGSDAVPSTSLGGAPNVSASNGDGANGALGKIESAVPEDTSKASAPAPAVMTGALPLDGDQSKAAPSLPKPAESTEKDGVEDVTGASAIPNPAASAQADGINGDEKKDTGLPTGLASDEKPSTTAPTFTGAEKKDTASSTGLATEDKPSTAASTTAPNEKEDVEMKDAALPPASEKPSRLASVAAVAPVADIGPTGVTAAPTTTPALATPATTAVAEATGGKRKADTDFEEPEAKKRKGALSRAIDKAKEAVQDVKEKAKPGRKPGKKAKKEAAPPPVGRTERKTRSQARAE